MERWEREGTQRVVPHGQIVAAPVSPLVWAAPPESPGAAGSTVLLQARCEVRRHHGKAGPELNPGVPRAGCRTPGACTRQEISRSRLDRTDGWAGLQQKAPTSALLSTPRSSARRGKPSAAGPHR